MSDNSLIYAYAPWHTQYLKRFKNSKLVRHTLPTQRERERERAAAYKLMTQRHSI